MQRLGFDCNGFGGDANLRWVCLMGVEGKGSISAGSGLSSSWLIQDDMDLILEVGEGDEVEYRSREKKTMVKYRENQDGLNILRLVHNYLHVRVRYFLCSLIFSGCWATVMNFTEKKLERDAGQGRTRHST